MTDSELKKWFNDLSNTEKLEVIRKGYTQKITNEYIQLLESKIEKLKEEEEPEEEEETVDDEDLLTQEIILANIDNKYEENGCHYVCVEGHMGIIHRQTKAIEDMDYVITYQTTIPQFKNRISFFINIYKTNQFKYIFVRGKNILFISISSMTILRPIIKIITDFLKYEDERKIENERLMKFKSLNNEINKMIDKHEEMRDIIKYIKEDRDNIIDKHEEKEYIVEKKEEVISTITGKPKRKYTKKI